LAEGDTPNRPTRLRFTVALSLLMLLSLVWGVAYTLASTAGDDTLLDEGDAFFYGLTAANAANGNWFQDPFTLEPAAEHPPMTVLVLVPASYVFDGARAQRLTMAVVGALAVGAIGLLGREVGGDRAGLLAATIALVNPNLWVNQALVMSEALAALFVALLLLAGYRLWRHPSYAWAAVVGALTGLAVLTRAEAGLFFVLMVVPILIIANGLEWRARAGRIGVAALCLVAVVAPWTVWLQTQFVEPVFVSTNDGLTLAGANCDETYHGELMGFWSIDCSTALLDDELDASQNSRKARREAFDFARENLERVPVVAVAREGRIFGFWRPDRIVADGELEGRPVSVSWAGLVVFWVLVPFAVLGAVEVRRREITLVPMVATLIAVVVVALLFYGIPRQRVPLDVVTCVLAAVAVGARLWPADRGLATPQSR
jgi:4-amino-4-deoxy-L-arabinose transferase-like glycosyltransferase